MEQGVTEADVLAAVARGRAGERDAKGDSPARAALARFVLENEAKVRAIARRKLPGDRGVFDSEDVVSSVLRRLDTMAHTGVFAPRSREELWGLIKAIASRTAVDRRRLIERGRNFLTEDGPYAYELLKRLNACPTDDDALMLVLRIMMSIKNQTDRQVFALLHRGASHRAIASALRLPSEEASRQRWSALRRELAARFAEGCFDA
jgi:hypothetical protein